MNYTQEENFNVQIENYRTEGNETLSPRSNKTFSPMKPDEKANEERKLFNFGRQKDKTLK